MTVLNAVMIPGFSLSPEHCHGLGTSTPYNGTCSQAAGKPHVVSSDFWLSSHSLPVGKTVRYRSRVCQRERRGRNFGFPVSSRKEMYGQMSL